MGLHKSNKLMSTIDITGGPPYISPCNLFKYVLIMAVVMLRWHAAVGGPYGRDGAALELSTRSAHHQESRATGSVYRYLHYFFLNISCMLEDFLKFFVKTLIVEGTVCALRASSAVFFGLSWFPQTNPRGPMNHPRIFLYLILVLYS